MILLPYVVPVVLFALAFGWLRFRIAWTVRHTSKLMNATDDWTLGPNRGAPIKWSMTDTIELGLQIAGKELEAGETLEGLARAYFWPRRAVDWSMSLRRLKYPLIIAATPRRILMFEIDGGMTVVRYCLIGNDEIQYLSAPQERAFANSGRLRFGLTSGREYQVQFSGPRYSEEGMRLEQRLSDHLRQVATRFPSSAPGAEAA
jgi:hypothetical protein